MCSECRSCSETTSRLMSCWRTVPRCTRWPGAAMAINRWPRGPSTRVSACSCWRNTCWSKKRDNMDQLCWHPSNPDLFVTASGDKTIRIWDVRTTKCIATVNTKEENVDICWSPIGQTIAVGNKDDVMTIIDAKTYHSKVEEQFKCNGNEISWNNMFFLTNILSYPELNSVQSINAHSSNCIKFDPMGKYFATGGVDALVSFWDIEGVSVHTVLFQTRLACEDLSFSHDAASEDHFIDKAEVETGDKLWEV